MERPLIAAALATLLSAPASAQEAVGDLTMTVEGEESRFVVIQGAEGPNPGSRFSRVGGDVVLTLVAVSGDQPIPPEEAAKTVELRFTVAAEEGPEVRAGSIVSYTTTDEEGRMSTRGGTAEIDVQEMQADDDAVAAVGSFRSELPPDERSAGTEVEGTFETKMKSRDPLNP